MTKKTWVRSYGQGKVSPHWAQSMVPSRLARKFFVALQRNKLQNQKILEIGCGNGRDSLFFASLGGRVVGIDISRNAVKLAQQNQVRVEAGKEVSFIQADAEKLVFKPRTFSSVYSIGVLHSTDMQKGFAEIARVLKKGGIAWLHLWQKTYFLKNQKTEILCVPEEVRKIIKELPFRIISFKGDIRSSHIDDADDKKLAHRHTALIIKLKKI